MKVLKVIGSAIIVISGAIFLVITLLSETLPEGDSEYEADELANKMLAAVNDSAWKNTGVVSWEYRGHHFIWDRDRHLTQVRFDGNTILIDINARKGVIMKGGNMLSKSEQTALCEKAWGLWVNDSFWLNPVSKCKDGGTTRKIVELNDGRQGLLVSYSSGGATPGDSYVWILDDNGRPNAWKFWVSIIPVKGMEFSWDGWVQLSTGAWISTVHEGLASLPISNPIGFSELSEMTNGIDIFESLENSEIYF